MQVENKSFVLSAQQEKSLFWLDKTAEILDNRFRIPFTNIRFGLDSIIGLFPYVRGYGGLCNFWRAVARHGAKRRKRYGRIENGG